MSNINDNLFNIINYLDLDSYQNLLKSQNSIINNQVNDFLVGKKDSTFEDFKKLYYQKFSIGYDKFDLAWKNNQTHWILEYKPENFIEKYYKLNYVWWFEFSYTFTNLYGKYRFKLNMNKGDLTKIYYYIIINDYKCSEKFIDLSKIPNNTDVKVITNYVKVSQDDKIKVIFYETNEPKSDMKIYCLEYI